MAAYSLCKKFSVTRREKGELSSLLEKLQGVSSSEKLSILDRNRMVKLYLTRNLFLQNLIRGLDEEAAIALKSVIAIGQAETVFKYPVTVENPTELFLNLIEQLLPLERFYKEIGGIIGYHFLMMQLCFEEETSALREFSEEKYYPPEGYDISVETPAVKEALLNGVTHLNALAEIYPLGGAADRLNLYDPSSQIPLPAALLNFAGKTLLEGIVRDLQAREYLYYKLFHEQLVTPIAMMTSREKENHSHILKTCEEANWFNRPKEMFRLFCQPLVPTIDKQGNWALKAPMQLLLKPGGHGVIWKLAQTEGIFDWLEHLGRKKALVRQINNPIAGVDYGLLAFLGFGCGGDKLFGFASCPSHPNAKEGINVLVERKREEGFEYLLTNVEYCDAKKIELFDISKFFSNTNLLFADLKAVQKAVAQCPFPGKIVNFKKATYRTETGDVKEEEIARLETMMQNIADFFKETYPDALPRGKRGHLGTFITFNHRHKTISTVKQAYLEGHPPLETPEGCFSDHLKNARELFSLCQIALPGFFIAFYHPALGPLYSIIAQKIKKGVLAEGSELQLEIADLSLEGLDLKGSLLIRAERPLGNIDAEGHLHYSHEATGKCFLKNVVIRNRGIDSKANNIYWKNEIVRQESCSITIQGNGEFYAENLTLEGNFQLTVKKGTRMVAVQQGDSLIFREEAIESPSWRWEYRRDEKNEIELQRVPSQEAGV
jgi:UTP---glucose-1-phosphate uridylyltransferase